MSNAEQIPATAPLYSTASPEEAFHCAVDAQRGSLWQTLLHSALHNSDMTCVVAGVVLSRPLLATNPLHCTPHNRNGSDCCSHETREFLCVSLGSGTRCVGVTPKDPTQYRSQDGIDLSSLVIRDGHAEVMARRGFVAFLLDAATQLTASETEAVPSSSRVTHPFVEKRLFSHTTDTHMVEGFALRSGVETHLVCTHWPCGALGLAAMGTTGGKIILETPSRRLAVPLSLRIPTNTTAADATVHVSGHVLAAHQSAVDRDATVARTASRVKPGKGHSNVNMSCTDKIWRWSALGMQGRRRLCLFPEPIVLNSMHVVQQKPSEGTVAASVENISRACAAVMLFRDQQLRTVTAPAHTMASQRRVPLAMSVAHVDWMRMRDAPIDAAAADSRYSRSAWVRLGTPLEASTERPSAGNKRPRDASSATPCPVECGDDDDVCVHSPHWHPSDTAAINTKAGLPQGSSVAQLQAGLQTLRRGTVFRQERERCQDAASRTPEANWVTCARGAVKAARPLTSKYPLSRAWFSQRVLQLALLPDHFHACQEGPHALAMGGDVSSICEDPAVWFFTSALSILDSSLFAQRALVSVREVDGSTRPVCCGGSPQHWLYAADAVPNTASDGQKPEEALLWVQKHRIAH